MQEKDVPVWRCLAISTFCVLLSVLVAHICALSMVDGAGMGGWGRGQRERERERETAEQSRGKGQFGVNFIVCHKRFVVPATAVSPPRNNVGRTPEKELRLRRSLVV